ncbi:MAG: N-methyl-L-tryptophan oxidase [Blastocatellia bacterium]|nr:N-methyl-L-tryptophan oxidase [Blastocatellia bacterium]
MASYDIAVIGAGIMGTTAACDAARRGARVALIDHSMPNPRASSIDHSKVFRFAYPDPLYARMAAAALPLWRALEDESRERLLTQTGILLIGESRELYETKTFETLRSLSLPVEMLDSRQTCERFPQFNAERFPYAVYDPSGAILHAERAVRASLSLARRLGVRMIEGERVSAIKRKRETGAQAAALVMESGSEIACERVLVASGAWARSIAPFLEKILTPTRQEVIYFEAPRAGFDAGQFPVFTALETGFYGFPIHHAGAMKIANHNKGEQADPLAFDDRVSDESIAECRTFFSEFIPALKERAVRETRVCLYNNTPDDDFIIDRHPEFENALIVTGFSGHGFKFAPLIGLIAAELLLSGRTSYDIDRFSLARFL